MKTRCLPPEEWHRLSRPDLPPSFPFADPTDVSVVVVEDEGGEIVACMHVIKVTHLESMWIDPRHRGNPGIMRSLLRQSTAIPAERGERWVMGGVTDGDDAMAEYLRRLGGIEMPVRFSALSIEKGS